MLSFKSSILIILMKFLQTLLHLLSPIHPPYLPALPCYQVKIYTFWQGLMQPAQALSLTEEEEEVSIVIV